MSNTPNPYQASFVPRASSPEDLPPDECLQRMVVHRLLRARDKGTSRLRFLFQWRSLPILLLFASTFAGAIYWLELPHEYLIAVVAFCAGAAARDIGFSREIVKLWAVQKHLFDWPKIESLAEKLGPP